uniref:Uncharacterized protein n=1 Tax=Panagrolaimus davidi TaxID=227884 RepID=A0A914P8G0_9BILA
MLYCWYEPADVIAMDEIFIASYWCMSSTKLHTTQYGKAPPNKLDQIMRHQILNAIEENTELLKIFLPISFPIKEKMKSEPACDISKPGNAEKNKNY